MSPIIDNTIGNRQDSATGTANPVYYCANKVNQYTYLDDASGTCPTPPSPTETFIHDADGNLIEDGTFDYTWDAENRLVKVQTHVPLAADPNQGDKLVEFKYDYMNRRVEKRYRVYVGETWTDQTGGWQRFVYDEWNVVLVLDASDSNATLKKYTWGLDLSGQSGDASVSGIHGAGGIGGLLAVEETAETNSPEYWFFYDANGNVGQVVNHATGYTVAAHYEYDPYGKVITSSGSYATDNPIRFSTKWFDTETGLGYWGYRYYSPRLGRWLSRDPVGELGGLNIYVFIQNDPIGSADPFGLWKWWDCLACAAALTGKLGGAFAGCALGCSGDLPPNLTFGECLDGCLSQFFDPCELWDQFKKNPAEWVGLAACISCGLKLLAAATSPEPPDGCIEANIEGDECPTPPAKDPKGDCYCMCNGALGKGNPVGRMDEDDCKRIPYTPWGKWAEYTDCYCK